MTSTPDSVSIALRQCAQAAPEATAFVGCAESSLTYEQWNDNADALAAVLRDQTSVGDTVIARLDERSDISGAVALFGALRAGCFVLPMSARFSDDDVARAGVVHSAKLVLVDGDADERAVARLGLRGLRIDGLAGAAAADEPSILGGAVVHTSGRTGAPAAVRWTHNDLLIWLTGWTGTPQCRPHLHAFRSDSGDALGRIVRTLLRYPGGRGPVAEPDNLVTIINRHRPVDMLLLATDAERFANGAVEQLSRPAAAGILSIYVTSGPTSHDTIDVLRRSCRNAAVTNVYGVAEAGRGQTWKKYPALNDSSSDSGTTPDAPDGLSAVGTPIFDTVVRIAGAGGERLPAGSVGRIWIRPGLPSSLSYCTGAGRSGVFHDGWVRTDDLGVLDEAGCLFLAHRRSR